MGMAKRETVSPDSIGSRVQSYGYRASRAVDDWKKRSLTQGILAYSPLYWLFIWGFIMKWDGKIPKRRYAIFTDTLRGEYMVVITEKDFDYAEKWGGFVQWVGGIRPAETRDVN